MTLAKQLVSVMKKKTNLSLSTGFDFGVTFFTNNIIDIFLGSSCNIGEGFCTIVGVISVNTPVFAIIPWSLDEHGFGTECFEGHDQMGEYEFSFQINLYKWW